MRKFLKNLKYWQIKRQVGLSHLNAKGISLVEVLVSAFLIAIVLISLTKIYYYAEYQTNIARHKTMAINLIQANFESLLSSGYKGIDTSIYPVTAVIVIDPGNSASATDDITGTMTTQLVNLNTDEGYKFITTSAWNEPFGGLNGALTEVAELLITDYE